MAAPGARGTLIGDAASISGGIGSAATVVFEQAADARYGGDIGALDGARGLMVKRGAGTLTLGGMSALDWSVEAGGLVTSAERMAGNAAIASGASLTWTRPATPPAPAAIRARAR